MSERERLIELIGKAKYVGLGTFKDGFLKSVLESLADHLLENGVIVLPRKLNLPDELYRYMFNDDRQPVPIKCKVVKTTGYGFTLKHPTDGRD